MPGSRPGMTWLIHRVIWYPMDDASFFGLSPQHVLMAAIGGVIFASYWLPRLVFPRAAASSALLMIFGAGVYTIIPGMPEALDPTASPRLWEVTSEIVVIVVLFATGLRIDNIGSYRLWQPTVRMLLIAMPLTIAAVGGLAWGLAGMT